MGTGHCALIVVGWMILAHLLLKSLGCGTGWFGPRCQYMCHCTDDRCDILGMCHPESQCAKPYFGLACQYEDKAITSQTAAGALTDHDDHSCIGGDEDVDLVRFRFFEVHTFSFMRIVLRFNDTLGEDSVESMTRNLNISLLFGGTTKCESENWKMNAQTIDIRCKKFMRYSEIVLRGADLKYACSVYISGGRNVALKQEVSSTGTSTDGNDASRAVDGIIADQSTSTCFVVQKPNKELLWELLLESSVDVIGFVLHHSLDGHVDDSAQIEIYIYDALNSLLATVPVQRTANDASTRIQVVLPGAAQRFVVNSTRVTSATGVHNLSICEFQLFGDCPYSKTGLGCKDSCGHCPGSACRHSVKCYQCFAGRSSTFCWEACNTCGGNGSCDLSRGVCQSGCKNGYTGKQCYEKCSNCAGLGACDQKTGACLEKCRSGFYGHECKSECGHCGGDGSCNESTGTCFHNCQTGWMGHACTQSCINCAGDGSCRRQDGYCNFGCLKGYRGDVCLLACKNCAGDGTCERRTGSCTIGCLPGFHGDICTETCSNCAGNGTCNRFNRVCHHGCKIGFKGATCDKKCIHCGGNRECYTSNGTCHSGCAVGYSGHDCEKPCPNCAGNKSCDQESSECLMGCEEGFQGLDCNDVCKHCGGDKSCHRYTGECLYGCALGYRGRTCNERTIDEIFRLTDEAMLFIFLGATVIIACLSVLFCPRLVCRRTKKPVNQTLSSPHSPPHSIPSTASTPETVRQVTEFMQTYRHNLEKSDMSADRSAESSADGISLNSEDSLQRQLKHMARGRRMAIFDIDDTHMALIDLGSQSSRPSSEHS